MSISTCSVCGGPFVPPPPGTYGTCMPCWKLGQGWELTQADKAHRRLSEELRDSPKMAGRASEMRAERNAEFRRRKTAEAELRRVRAALDAAQLELGILRMRLRGVERIKGTLGPDKVRALIKLCHPDRHPEGLQGLANEVTAWLLPQRRS